MKQLIGIFVLALAASSVGAQPEMAPEMEMVAAELWQLGMADTEGTHFCRAEFRKGSHRYEGSAWCDAGGKTAVNWQGFRVPIERELAAAPLLGVREISWDHWALAVLMHWRAGHVEQAEAIRQRFEVKGQRGPWAAAALSQFVNEIHIRAVEAHGGGDTAEALALSRRLLPYRRLPIRGLSELPKLVADLERRLARGPRPHLHPARASLPQLIDSLDEIDVVYSNSLGDRRRHPIMARLWEFGDDGMDALVAVVDHDTRLTRSYTVPRSFHGAGVVKPVREAIWEFVQEYVGAWRFLDPAQPGALRKWWELNRHKTPAHRLLAILADDQAGEDAWFQATLALLRRNGPSPALVAALTDEHAFAHLAAQRAVQTAKFSRSSLWIGTQLIAWNAAVGSRALAEAGRRPFELSTLRPYQAAGRDVLRRQAKVFVDTWWLRYQHAPKEQRPEVTAAYVEMLRRIPDKAREECADILRGPVLRDPVDPLLVRMGEELASLKP